MYEVQMAFKTLHNFHISVILQHFGICNERFWYCSPRMFTTVSGWPSCHDLS